MRTSEPLENNNADLLSRAQRGDQRAFNLLMPLYIGDMKRKLRGMVKSQQDVDDILQIVLYRVWRALPKFRGESMLSTWMFRIVHNE